MTIRHLKTYTGSQGYDYQYYFVGKRPSPESAAHEYTFDVTSDRKLTYAVSVFLPHKIEYGSTSEQLGSIAVACRDRAQANPAAQMHGRPLTMDDYLSARMISAPLRLYDYCLETDGAAAVVVTSAERARDCRGGAVLIQTVAQASLPGTRPGMMFPGQPSGRHHLAVVPGGGGGALGALRPRPTDIDVAQLYDCFTITLLLQLEDYGFAKRGEG